MTTRPPLGQPTPPGQPPAQPTQQQPQRRQLPPPVRSTLPPPIPSRGGCRGCLFTCLGLSVAFFTIVAVTGLLGYQAVRQSFPLAGSARDTAICAALRIAVTYGERAIEQAGLGPAERAQARRGIQDVRVRFERDCRPSP